jgi:hypothetical protein
MSLCRAPLAENNDKTMTWAQVLYGASKAALKKPQSWRSRQIRSGLFFFFETIVALCPSTVSD